MGSAFRVVNKISHTRIPDKEQGVSIIIRCRHKRAELINYRDSSWRLPSEKGTVIAAFLLFDEIKILFHQQTSHIIGIRP